MPIFQEDEYTDFVAKDTISTLIYKTNLDCKAGYIFNPMKNGIFEGIFSWGGVSLTPLRFIFPEKLVQY